MQRMHGSRTGPPADIEYAVEPVGVDITIPSERMDCAATPFAKRSKERSFETGPFESTTSLSAGYSVRSTSSPDNRNVKHYTLFDIAFSGDDLFYKSELGHLKLGEISELAEIDSDDRNFQGCVFSCGGNDRSVSAEDKYKIDIFAREIISVPATSFPCVPNIRDKPISEDIFHSRETKRVSKSGYTAFGSIRLSLLCSIAILFTDRPPYPCIGNLRAFAPGSPNEIFGISVSALYR